MKIEFRKVETNSLPMEIRHNEFGIGIWEDGDLVAFKNFNGPIDDYEEFIINIFKEPLFEKLWKFIQDNDPRNQSSCQRVN